MSESKSSQKKQTSVEDLDIGGFISQIQQFDMKQLSPQNLKSFVTNDPRQACN